MGIADTANIFVNGQGPYQVNGAVSAATDIVVQAAGTQDHDFANTDMASSADIKFPVYKTAADTYITAGKILMLNGRRYKVKSSTTSGIAGKATLTENFAGGQLLQMCATCITAGTTDGKGLTSGLKLNLAVGDQLLVGGYVHQALMVTVATAVTDAKAIVTSAGCHEGTPIGPNAATGISGVTVALYRLVNGPGYKGAIVTESASTLTFQYVSQCSNRGTCDATTGICKCYKGYSNDNCDNQNMLAM